MLKASEASPTAKPRRKTLNKIWQAAERIGRGKDDLDEKWPRRDSQSPRTLPES